MNTMRPCTQEGLCMCVTSIYVHPHTYNPTIKLARLKPFCGYFQSGGRYIYTLLAISVSKTAADIRSLLNFNLQGCKLYTYHTRMHTRTVRNGESGFGESMPTHTRTHTPTDWLVSPPPSSPCFVAKLPAPIPPLFVTIFIPYVQTLGDVYDQLEINSWWCHTDRATGHLSIPILITYSLRPVAARLGQGISRIDRRSTFWICSGFFQRSKMLVILIVSFLR